MNITPRHCRSGTITRSKLAGLVWLAVIGLSGCVNHPPQQTGTSAPAQPFTVFLVGDSTMSNKRLIPADPERGWGQLLPLYFKEGVRVANHAVNGRSSKSFLEEGKWEGVRSQLLPGDYVIVQFGSNDEHRDNPKQYTAPFGEFKTNLLRYVRETRERRARPILATPVPRRSFTATAALRDTHGDYSVAVRQVAAEERVPLLDLDRRCSAELARLGPEPSKRWYNWIPPGEYATRPEGSTDNSHLNAYGATRTCDLAVDEMQTATPELARSLRR